MYVLLSRTRTQAAAHPAEESWTGRVQKKPAV